MDRNSINKPIILALNQTITWEGKLAKRKVFSKDQIIELIKQVQTDQYNADIAWFEKWLLLQAKKDSITKFGQTKAYELWQRFINTLSKG